MNQKTNICGILSLVFSIQALITCCVPILSFILAGLALIAGVFALTQKECEKGQAIAGVCCAVSAITISAMIYYVTLKFPYQIEELMYNLDNIRIYW